MATKLYLRNSTNATSGLPTTEQSTNKTPSYNLVAQNINNNMLTTKGTAQVERFGSFPDDTTCIYLGRWVSPPITVTSISANTWTLNFAAWKENTDSEFPVEGTNQPLGVNCYVWRPGTGKVGTILDGNTASVYDSPSAADSERVMHGTFSGSAVSGIQTNDVLIIELFTVRVITPNTNDDCAIYFDGTTENTTENAVVSNHASYIETPEDNLFGAGTTPVSQTSIHKYNLLRNITQTSIHKYNIRIVVAVATSIQKYNLRTFVTATASIQKYNLKRFILATTIHKYGLGGMVLVTTIQKYNLRKFLAQTTIQKYNLRKNLAQTIIHKYNMKALIAQTSIHKYKMAGVVLVSTIHKYNLRRYLAQTIIHKYNLRITVAATALIQKYNLRRFIPQTIIHKYNMRAQVLQTSTQKYNLGPSLPIDMTQTNTKTYSNKFIVKT